MHNKIVQIRFPTLSPSLRCAENTDHKSTNRAEKFTAIKDPKGGADPAR